MASRKFKLREREISELALKGMKYNSKNHEFWCVVCKETFRSDRVELARRHVETAKHKVHKEVYFMRHDMLKEKKIAAEHNRTQREDMTLVKEALLQLV